MLLSLVRKVYLPPSLIGIKSLCLSSKTMGRVYLRHINDSEQFLVEFRCKYDKLNIDRSFNFCRKLSENVSAFSERVRCNVERVINKKSRKKKKSVESEETPESVKVVVMHNSVEVPGSNLCKDVFFGELGSGNLSIFILDRNYEVIINAPWVDSLSLPSSVMAGFPVYPSKISLLFCACNTSKFMWFKTKDSAKEEWLDIGSGQVYTPGVSDIGWTIKLICTPSDGEKVGPEVEAVCGAPVQAGPGLCPFEERHLFTQESAPKGSFRIVSYNILADVYAETEVAKTQLFPYCPSHALTLDYRKQLYLRELLGYNADIICLQEVDSKVFHSDLKFVLGSKGFEGQFCRKGSISEGLAIFFRTEKFRLLDTKNVILGQEVSENPTFSYIWNNIKNNEVIVKRLSDRGTAVQVLLLESVTKPKDKLVVGNLHLYFSPDADHIRLLQGAMTVRLLEHFISQTAEKYPGDNVSLVLCGDFNSTPDCGTYQLLTTKHVPESFHDWKCNKDEIIEGFELSQPFSMASAYGTPPFTNYTVGFSGCLDYIYYQQDKLSLNKIVPLPEEDDIKVHIAIPNVVYPSDHLALVADLEWN